MNELKKINLESTSLPAGSDGILEPTFGLNEVYIDTDAEKRITSKFDKFMMPQMALIMIIAYLDRSNIGNAVTFGFKEGIGLVGTEFNNLATLFYPLYVVCEIPWVMAVKRYGANSILMVAMIGWSAVSLGTGFVKNYHQAIAMRILLGIFEAALFPSLTFIVSTAYRREQQALMIAILYGSTAISGAFGGLLAYAIQLMGSRKGLAPWRWLFIIEGCISVVVGGALWFTLPRHAQKAWFLTSEEKLLLNARTQRDAVPNEEQKFEWKYLRMALSDPLLWAASIGLFCSSIPFFGFGTFLPTIIQGLGYNSLQANYLSIPVYTFACLTLWLFAWLSDRLKKRALMIMVVTVPVLIGYAISIATPNNGAGLFAMFLVAAGRPYTTSLPVYIPTHQLTTEQPSDEHVRSIGIPLVICIANASDLASSQIYPSADSPRYVVGSSVSLGMEAVALVCAGAMASIIKRRNARSEIKDGGVEFVL
ncbi:hypothetical protein BP5796_03765 [Coleophoma crateriformis]|uniref:Major facilitator superfamily (MFS) profile domain-containing protein n=1 Tax=Coleophoma crateriformis TaxID=565419 RepID=A0A3D8SGH9_9HELO|nr:hypothetical protein BP5796_03765 [Coleophoma crateriformis]